MQSLCIAMTGTQDSNVNIEIWKMKKMIKTLDGVRGNGTSMVSLIINPRDQISRVVKMLAEEYRTVSNIKNRVNRQSVLTAITSGQSRLKLYRNVPCNGLVVYTGTGVTEDGKQQKFSDEKLGFIVIDGNGTFIGTSSGRSREILHKFTVDLPKKHGRGGQSALRFSRLRAEKRHNYLRKAAELAAKYFIDPATVKVNVDGLILAGSAEFKTELSQSDMFDSCLRAKILKVVDISYGGKKGFDQAIELSFDVLSNVNVVKEKRLIGKFFEEISQDTGKYVFGVDDTIMALEMGSIQTLIIWEDLDISRYALKISVTNEIVIKYLNKEQETDDTKFQDSATGSELKVQEKLALVDWFADQYKQFGCSLEFVTNKSQEGSKFCRGYGGIGGILRYQLNIRSFDEAFDDGEAAQDNE
ncbi:hypothetical protein Pint_05788 [Pistacia integerrima]|uniref:Uncharacterized protein n=1 Tax=Pistacia integerrima TaxID=434235 RepID=A0ACC0Z941_9ROSI|nr:hypothetical protein Pint_05788 [Pistacia integerrima]